ncbi:MAG: alpha/beta fold hydrolase [Anaerolineales bacterium]|nr:alpha/beta fold hydrolase [Anaerolineales bacterium]
MSKIPFGALLIHGFTATPDSFRGITPHLESLGIPCKLPTLRGHGADTPEALVGVHWTDWIADCENALIELCTEAEQAIVLGHSLGGWLALNLAVDHQEKIDSIIIAGASTRCVSPLTPGRPFHFLFPLLVKLLKKWDMPSVYADPELAQYDPTYDWVPMDSFIPLFDFLKVTKKRLPEVNVPILILHSKNDSSNAPEGVDVLYHTISTPGDQKQVVWFEKTEHDMFLDCEGEEMTRTVVEYVKQRMDHAR